VSERIARYGSLCIAVLTAALAVPGAASAAGGHYVIDGGTPQEQAQVRAALDASRYEWSLVPAQITITIRRGYGSCGVPGQIFLDANLLDAGHFSWGVVQHEYAHQVDFFLLDDAGRALLAAALGGRSWWQTSQRLPHGELTSERFASTLAWAYWPTPDNVMRPSSPGDEAGSPSPEAFRALLSRRGYRGAAPSIEWSCRRRRKFPPRSAPCGSSSHSEEVADHAVA